MDTEEFFTELDNCLGDGLTPRDAFIRMGKKGMQGVKREQFEQMFSIYQTMPFKMDSDRLMQLESEFATEVAKRLAKYRVSEPAAIRERAGIIANVTKGPGPLSDGIDCLEELGEDVDDLKQRYFQIYPEPDEA
jgi:hypothetical protein